MKKTKSLSYFANPNKLLKLFDKIYPVAFILMIFLFAIGLYFSFFASPEDYQQGHTVKIMYVHVPAAWMAMCVYSLIALFNSLGLIYKHQTAFLLAKASAPIGLIFTIMCLLTGSLWGKPMWGTWWVWDARLTSVFLLLLLYLGYIALNYAFENSEKTFKASAWLSILGIINLPIIKWSVDWWNTLHQPASVIRLDGPTIHHSMLTPLFLMAFGYFTFYITVLILRFRAEIIEFKIKNHHLRRVM